MVLNSWKMPANANFNGFSIFRVSEMTESLYIDNLYVYEGQEPVRKLPGAAFNPEGEEFWITQMIWGISAFSRAIISPIGM